MSAKLRIGQIKIDKALRNMGIDDRTLITELSMLNKQLAAFAWHLVDTEVTPDEQLALIKRLEDVREMIRLRVDC